MVSTAPSRLGRFFQQPIVRGLVGFFWVLGVVVMAQVALALLPLDDPWVNLLGAVVVALVALAAYAVFVRVLERRNPAAGELAPGPAARELAEGVLAGALLFGLTIGTLAALGLYRVTGSNEWTVILPALSLGVVSGVFEELLFRGILFRIAQEGLGTWLALLLSAAIFGLLHLANPNATLAAGLAIAIEAGLLMGAAYAATGRLWVPIGLHFAWNFVQGGIFGVAVSGNAVTGLLQGELRGPELLSGGEFGAEASIVAVVVCVAGAAFYAARARRGGRLAPGPWRRRTAATRR